MTDPDSLAERSREIKERGYGKGGDPRLTTVADVDEDVAAMIEEGDD